MYKFIKIEELRACLIKNEHHLAISDLRNFSVCPESDISITLALQPDQTLYPERRRRFFLCRSDAEAILAGTRCSQSTRQKWANLLLQIESGSTRDLLAGPASWSLGRFAPAGPLFVWADGSRWWDKSVCNAEYQGIEAELEKHMTFAPFKTHLSEGASRRAYSLDPEADYFLETFAAYFILSSNTFREIFFSNANFTEVHKIHHHEKIEIFIPNFELRQNVINQLCKSPEIYTDVSAFTCSWDDDPIEPPTD